MAARKHSRARLTPAAIEALRPRDERYDVTDPAYAGLVVRVMPSGAKVFRWRAKRPGRVVVLGPWAATATPAHLTLHEAREWHEKLREARTGGEARLEEVLAQLRRHLEPLAAVAPTDRRTFEKTAEEWYADDIEKNRKHPDDVRAMLDHDLLPSLGPKPLDEITTLECRDAIRRIVTGKGRPGGRAAPVHAGKVLSTLKQFFGWAQSNGFTDRNPAFPLKGRHLGVEVNSSDRWLTAEEIPLFWHALDADPGPKQVERPDPRTGKVQVFTQRLPTLAPATAAAMKILLLTAVRTGELLRARWEHVDFKARTWTIPVENQKLTKAQERRAKPFVIPLPPAAVALFEQLQELAGESRWVMAGTGDSGHYDEKAFGHALRRLTAAKVLVLPGGTVTPHDLRRTARTHLGKLKVPHWIVERVLNHSLGKIAATYDQHDYFEERREALEKWAAFVERLVSPQTAKVAFLGA